MTHIARRALSALTATALLAGLLVGTPSAARAAHGADWYVAMEGGSYAGVAGCTSPDQTANGTSDNVEVQLIVSNPDFETGDHVWFCGGNYHFTDEVFIDEDAGFATYIESTGGSVSISGGNTTRLFESTGSLTLNSMTLKDGYVDHLDMGGAVLAGAITAQGVTFTNNYASAGGGAIASYADGDIDALFSTFTGNEANDMGGAIGTFGDVNAVGSTFTNNVSHADYECTGGGGAIAAVGLVTANGSTFTGNKATVDAADLAACNWEPYLLATDESGRLGGLGGAIATLGTVSVHDSIFTKNVAEAGGGAIMQAGLLLGGNCSDATNEVYDSIFTNNSTNARMGRAPISAGVMFGGGAILSGNVQTCNDLVIHSDSFTNNSSMGNGGAIDGSSVTIESSTFTRNFVSGRVSDIPAAQRPNGSFGGGAVAAIAANIVDSTFIGNTAPSGGAVLAFGCGAFAVGSTFTGNEATSSLPSFGGGAIHGVVGCLVGAANSTFTRNRAAGGGGAVWFGLIGYGQAEWVNELVSNPGNWLFGNTISNNQAGAGGAIAFSSCTKSNLKSTYRELQRANRMRGNRAGRYPLVALLVDQTCYNLPPG